MEEWTKGRLDDLSGNVVRGFQKIDQSQAEIKGELQAVRAEAKSDLQAVRAEVKSDLQAVRAEVRTEFTSVRKDLGEIRAQMGDIQRTMIHMIVALTAAMLTGFAGIFALLAAAL